MPLLDFSQDDLELLRWAINDARKRKRGEVPPEEPPNTVMSPEVYIASKSTGWSSSGTGAAESAEFQVARISNTDTNLNNIEDVTDLLKDVFRLEDHDIILRDKFGKWLQLESGSSLIPFELYDDHAPGATSTAYRLKLNESSTFYDIDEDADTIEVVDCHSCFRGYGRVDAIAADPEADPPVVGEAAIPGFRGWATKGDNGYDIVYLEPGVRMFYAELDSPTAEIHPDYESFDIDPDTAVKLFPTDQAPWYTTNLKPPTVVLNTFGISGIDGFHKGMVMMWYLAVPAYLPPDWERMDGDGPSGIDMTDPEKFPRGYILDSEITNEVGLGSIEHTHTINEHVTDIYADYDDGPDVIFTTFSSGSQYVHDPGHPHTAETAEHIPPYQHFHFIEYLGVPKYLLCIWNDTEERYVALKCVVGDQFQTGTGT